MTSTHRSERRTGRRTVRTSRRLTNPLIRRTRGLATGMGRCRRQARP
jgi:hypothetical protein